MQDLPTADEIVQECSECINMFLGDGTAQLKAFSRQHREDVKEQDAQIAHLEQQKRRLKELGAEVNKGRELELRNIGKLEKDLRELKLVEEAHPRQLMQVQTQIEAERNTLVARQKVMQEKENHIHIRQTELDRAIKAYEKWLGLEIEHVGEDKTKFTFTHVNQAKPEDPFSFSLFLAESGKYEVSTCQPAVDYQASLEGLNRSKAMLPFFVAMRKSFAASLL